MSVGIEERVWITNADRVLLNRLGASLPLRRREGRRLGRAASMCIRWAFNTKAPSIGPPGDDRARLRLDDDCAGMEGIESSGYLHAGLERSERVLAERSRGIVRTFEIVWRERKLTELLDRSMYECRPVPSLLLEVGTTEIRKVTAFLDGVCQMEERGELIVVRQPQDSEQRRLYVKADDIARSQGLNLETILDLYRRGFLHINGDGSPAVVPSRSVGPAMP